MSHIRFTVLVGIALIGSIAPAQEPDLHFHLTGDTFLGGRLVSPQQEHSFAVEADGFSDPIEFNIETLREARSKSWQREIKLNADAVLTKYDQRFVGEVAQLRSGDVQVKTSCLGTVRITADDIVDQIRVSEIAFRLLPLHQSRWRWELGQRWNFERGRLIAVKPYEATLGKLDLPERFRLRLSVRCEGSVDFDFSLGDRRADAKALDTWRGGSRPRLPQESLITRLEWVGDSVALVRSNGSVSDAEVFLNSGGSETLQLELFVDQQRGSITAWSDGRMVAGASLTDEIPAIHSDLTLINRGAPVTVERMDVLFWNGESPESGVVTWSGSGAGQGGSEVWNEGVVEVLLRDGCRVTGRLESDDGSRLRIHSGQGSWRFRCEDVVRLLGNPSPDAESADSSDVLLVVLTGEQIRLKGKLVAAGAPESKKDEKVSPVAWHARGATRPVGMRSKSDVQLQWPSHKAALSSEAIIELINGDRVVGKCLSVDRNAVRIESSICTASQIQSASVRRILFQEHEAVDPELLAALLTVPRKMKADPPTHLVIAANGDAVRGRLISMDRQSINLEVRAQPRKIPIQRVAEMIWLDDKMDPSNPGDFTVWSGAGDRMRLATMWIEGDWLRGRHVDFGECRWPMDGLIKVQMRGVQWDAGNPWSMTPAKEPRDFAEEE